jgi:checkpoint serine/threonine-protein kinase
MSVEFSFEELRARHRGWLDRDWAAIRREEKKQARKLAEEAAAAQLPKPKPAPLAPKQEPLTPKQDAQKPPKPQTVPLKGGEDDAAGDDENRPPSQADVEKAKAAKKARKEERANRTRKIQVMDVKEISGETQTSKHTENEMRALLTCTSPSEARLAIEEVEGPSKERWP